MVEEFQYDKTDDRRCAHLKRRLDERNIIFTACNGKERIQRKPKQALLLFLNGHVAQHLAKILCQRKTLNICAQIKEALNELRLLDGVFIISFKEYKRGIAKLHS